MFFPGAASRQRAVKMPLVHVCTKGFLRFKAMDGAVPNAPMSFARHPASLHARLMREVIKINFESVSMPCRADYLALPPFNNQVLQSWKVR